MKKNIENFGKACEALGKIYLFHEYEKISETQYLLTYQFFNEDNGVEITYNTSGNRIEITSDWGNTEAFNVSRYVDCYGICDAKCFLEVILGNLKDVISNDAIDYFGVMSKYAKIEESDADYVFKNIDAYDFANSLVKNSLHNIMNGRLSGEHIPYYYEKIESEYYVGCFFDYNSEVGLHFHLFYPLVSDTDNNEYSHFLDWVRYVETCIDLLLDDVDIDDVVGAIKGKCIPFTLDDAKEKTQFLTINGCLSYR